MEEERMSLEATKSSSSSSPATAALLRDQALTLQQRRRRMTADQRDESSFVLPSLSSLPSSSNGWKRSRGDFDTLSDQSETTTPTKSCYDNLTSVLMASLFPSIQWPTTLEYDENSNDNDKNANPQSGGKEEALDRQDTGDSCDLSEVESQDDDDDDDEQDVGLIRPAKRARAGGLKRAARRFEDLSSCLGSVNDNSASTTNTVVASTTNTVGQFVLDICPVLPETETYRALTEYAQPMSLVVFFRLFQSHTTPLAYQWCAAIAVGHTLYSIVTDFGGTRTTTTATAARTWPYIDFISHQVMDSFMTHALITTMLLHPDKFGSNAFYLAMFLIQTQPIHLTMWFKSNFVASNQAQSILLHNLVFFAIASLFLMLSQQQPHETLTSLLLYHAGVLGFNLAPLYILSHACVCNKKQETSAE